MKNVENSKADTKSPVTKLLGTIAIGGTLAASLMACSPSTMSNTSSASSLEFDQVTYTFGEGLSASKEDQAKIAEEMALVAEKLIRTNTIAQANKLAFRALEHNQYNIRAQFVLKATSPMMELKGIYRRILPIVSVRPDKYREYQSFLKQIGKDQVNPETTDFLLDGKPDLHTEGQVQDVLEKFIERTDELRDWLKENRTVAHTVNFYQEQKLVVPACTATEDSKDVWTLRNCNRDVKKVTAQMNIADFAMARQIVAGLQVYLAIGTTYSLDGVFKAGANLPEEWESVQKKHAALSQIKGVGQLRNTKLFAMLPQATVDLVTGMKYAQKMHTQLCAKGSEVAANRPGMLFDRGICVETSKRMDRMLSLLNLAARGQLINVDVYVGNGQDVRMTLDAKAFLKNPIKDLAKVPVTFGACGLPTSIGDGSANGLFPNADLNVTLQKTSANECHN